MSKSMYETPSTEVVVVRIERTILSGIRSSRSGYGIANDGQTEDGAEWVWN